MSMNFKYIKYQVQNQIAEVSLNRPNKKNAMSFAMMRELMAVAKTIERDRTIRAVILQGVGDDFCTGIDLSDLNQPKSQAFAIWELIKPWQSLFQRVCLVWRSLPVPVIAVIKGHCLGAGLQLALACDIRIADIDSKFAILEAKWGLVADMGITQSALGIINADVLKELAMTARMIEGVEAKKFGLISHLSTEPLSKAFELSEELKHRSPDAILGAKRVINQMHKQSKYTLYQEKFWQTKLIVGKNRKLAMKKAKASKDNAIEFVKRQWQ